MFFVCNLLDFISAIGEVPEPKQELNRPAQWRCAICTYDNDEDMSACDICGVIRNPTAGNYINSDKRTGFNFFFLWL